MASNNLTARAESCGAIARESGASSNHRVMVFNQIAARDYGSPAFGGDDVSETFILGRALTPYDSCHPVNQEIDP